jgi:hypothetical protein
MAQFNSGFYTEINYFLFFCGTKQNLVEQNKNEKILNAFYFPTITKRKLNFLLFNISLKKINICYVIIC